jgi:hypothetical protein
MVRMYEGVGKSALAMVGVAGAGVTHLIPGTDATGLPLATEALLIRAES